MYFFALISQSPSLFAQTFSTRSGWGATPYSGGVTFRVWAPNASSVHLTGSYNNSLVAEPGGTGIWSVDVAGAVEGGQYKYVLNGNLTKQDPRSRRQISSVGNCYVYNTTNFNWTGDTFSSTNIPLTDAVVYELHCGTFNGSPGTFYNATNKLAFLKQLGVSVVEVMPIAEFPGDSSWGYNPSDIFGVESAYGGPDAFKSFVKTAHQLGMAVILDVIHNHYGPNDLDLWRFDGSYVSLGGTNYGGIYFYQQNGPCCTPWGSRPNYGTQQVRNFIQDNFTMWLSECHVDGFRWDSPGTMIYYTGGSLPDGSSLIQQISSMIHTAYVGKINIGEDQNQFTGTAGFDATWNGNSFFNNVEPQLAAASDSGRSMSAINSAINLGWGNVIFLESHDLCGDLNGSGAQRLPVRIDSGNPASYNARKRSALGAALTLTAASIPMLLEGEEMLTPNQFSASTPLNWTLTNTYSGNVSLYTDLIRLRRNLDGRSSGLKGTHSSTIFLQDSGNNKVIAYRRYNTGSVGDDVIVIGNFANTSWTNYNVTGFPHTGVWYTQLNSDLTKYGSDYGNFGSLSTTVAVSTATINIAPYSVLILSQNTPGAPPTPQNPRVVSVNTNLISIAWDVSGGSTGYIVKRGGSQIATTSTNAYTDTGLVVGAQYCYTVAATNNTGAVSADSASVCATTLPATGATNLLAYWNFDEGGGSIAYDSSGNNNTGTVVGAAWTSGMVNGALSLNSNSTTNQVTATNSVSLNPVNGITIAAWVYDNSGGWYNTPRILEKGKTDNQYALFINSSGSLEFLLTGVSNGILSISPPSSYIWHHLAASYDGSSLISLYIDGLLATQHVASGALPITTDSLAIGAKPGSGSPFNFFNGIIDDLRIYGSALPAAQIAQLYQTDTVGDGVPNWWRSYYFGVSSSTDATTCASCDYDMTGQNNLFKYVAGLNPTDSTQIFTLQIASVTNQPNQMDLTFNPVAEGRTYAVQSSPDLSGGAFSDLTSPSDPQTNGTQVTVTDLNAVESNTFYRVHISLP